jgi:hypothetical protein
VLLLCKTGLHLGRELNNDDTEHLHFSANIIRKTKSKIIRWAGYKGSRGDKRNMQKKFKEVYAKVSVRYR